MNHLRKILNISILQGRFLLRSLSHSRIIWEENKIGILADGKCTVQMGSASVLATVICDRKPSRLLFPLPLQVEFHEHSFRSERLRRDREFIAAQMIERAVRPLFPSGFPFETNLTVTVLAADQNSDLDVSALNASSGALMNSDILITAPFGACKMAKYQNSFLFNPSVSEIENSDFVLTLAATVDKVLLCEGYGKEISQSSLCEMMDLARSKISNLIKDQLNFQPRLPKKKFLCNGADPIAAHRVMELAKPLVQKIHLQAMDGKQRKKSIEEAKVEVEKRLEELGAMRSNYTRIAGSGCVSPTDLLFSFMMIENTVFKESLWKGGIRPDGRFPLDTRLSTCEVNLFPAVHGSSLQRLGDTQCAAAVMVHSPSSKAFYESSPRLSKETFLVDYRIPLYASKDFSRQQRFSKEDIAKGFFINKTFSKLLPAQDEFPFSIRVDAEVTSSDGSALMAAVCGISGALQSAGIPLKTPMAGVSIGSVSKHQTNYFEKEISSQEDMNLAESKPPIFIIDLQETEEFHGDMSFQVCGTDYGITSLQLTVLRQGGVPMETLKSALSLAEPPLKKLLGTIRGSTDLVDRSRSVVTAVHFPTEYFGALLGPHGETLQELELQTNTRIALQEESEEAMIYSKTVKQFEQAKEKILDIQGANIYEGEVYSVKVIKVMDYGALVQLPTGFHTLLHISELSVDRIDSITDVLSEGQVINVKCLGRRPNGDIRLSLKALELDQQSEEVKITKSEEVKINRSEEVKINRSGKVRN